MRGGSIDYETYDRISCNVNSGGLIQLVCYGVSDIFLDENLNDNKMKQIVKNDTFVMHLNENKDVNKDVKKDNVFIKTYKSFINFILKPKLNL